MGASQLRGEERTDVDDAPAPARNILMPIMVTMNMQMRLFSYRTTGLSNCITDDIKTCNNGGFMIVFGLKLVYLWCFYGF